MKLYQDFEIELQDNQDEFIAQLLANIQSSREWRIDEALQKEKQSDIAGWKDKVYCIVTPKINYEDNILFANIWLSQKDNKLEIVNITPKGNSMLLAEEYNFIIAKFEETFINPLKKVFEFKVTKSDEELNIKNYLTDDGEKALVLFSGFANKLTGHNHPLDFERWCNFIFLAHKANNRLPMGYLEEWLQENGWPADKAEELALDFSYSMRLLDEYDK